MRCLLATTLFLLSFLSLASTGGTSKNGILLSDVKTITLSSGRQTTNRRVPSIPQLRCSGPKRVCSLYNVDVMQCTNEGYDYDEEDVQWSCSASLPAEFKLGETEVICEGYRSADDKWVLKGSCGVEYRLLLTDVGEEKFGRVGEYDEPVGIAGWIMYAIVFGFICFILFKICTGNNGDGGRRGWGGGGGGGWYPPHDPPPPYDNSRPWSSGPSSSSGPGFYTGAAMGGAAGYGLGRRWGRSSNRDRWAGGSGSPGPSSSHQSTGFGSTRRR